MAQHKRDYYQVLEVPKNAPGDEIKKAYRQAALKSHPDRHPGDKQAEARFKEATEAYQILSDPQKRRIYDQYGHAGLEQNGGGFQGAGNFGDIFEDIFEDFFGGRPRSGGARPQKGGDLEYALDITFQEAATGVERSITIEREETCAACKGDGAKPGTTRGTCPTCNGQGQVLAQSGFFSIARTCPRCHGAGSFVEHPCTGCRGTGRVAAKRNIDIKVPAGIDSRQRLRVSGEGEAGFRGGPRGDLYIEIHVATHDLFEREAQNIICRVSITFAQAALGAEIEVPTLSGVTKLKIPAGTQSGKVFTLKGKGMPSLRGGQAGDELIHVSVETPTHLSDKQKELLRQFAALSGEKVSPIKKFFSK